MCMVLSPQFECCPLLVLHTYINFILHDCCLVSFRRNRFKSFVLFLGFFMPSSQINPEDIHETASHLLIEGSLLQIQYHTFADNLDPDTSLKRLKSLRCGSGFQRRLTLYVQISVGTMASFVPTEGMRFCSDRKSRGNWTRKPRILRSSS